MQESLLLQHRLPRIVLACLVGCSLTAAGAAYQGMFHNPMSAPDILGASSGTSFIKMVTDPDDQLPAITYWLMGSLNGSTPKEVLFVLIPFVVGETLSAKQEIMRHKISELYAKEIAELFK